MALAKANRLESLYKHSKRPQSSLRGPGGTTERRTDRPTDKLTNKKGFENMQNGFDPCFHHAKRNRTHMTCKNKAVQKTFQNKFKCFHCRREPWEVKINSKLGSLHVSCSSRQSSAPRSGLQPTLEHAFSWKILGGAVYASHTCVRASTQQRRPKSHRSVDLTTTDTPSRHRCDKRSPWLELAQKQSGPHFSTEMGPPPP